MCNLAKQEEMQQTNQMECTAEHERCLCASPLYCRQYWVTPPQEFYALPLVRPQILRNARRYCTTDGSILATIGLRVSTQACMRGRYYTSKSSFMWATACCCRFAQASYLWLDDRSTGDNENVESTAAAPPRRWWLPHPLASDSCQMSRRAGAAAHVGRLAARLPGRAVPPAG